MVALELEKPYPADYNVTVQQVARCVWNMLHRFRTFHTLGSGCPMVYRFRLTPPPVAKAMAACFRTLKHGTEPGGSMLLAMFVGTTRN